VNGKVYLVGAGPGDPELLTLKALNLLRRADAVLHDDLVSPEILSMASPKARYDVGKRSGQKSTRQEAIHFLMIELARQGLQVVRLKGGDPMIFGRAGEEIQALRQARIEFEVVPGVTSALAAAAAAEISLTLRDTASSLLIMTGHFAKGDEDEHALPDLRALVASGTTIALYMPGSEPSVTVNKLVAAGLARKTPCAVISRATTPTQQITVMTLAELGLTWTHAKPSILLIGDVVRLSRYDQVRLNDVFSRPFPPQAEVVPQPKNGVVNHG
jgi:uroporphyrin-III C-methyltransferase